MRIAVPQHASFNLIHYKTSFKVDVFVRKPGPFDTQQFERRRAISMTVDPSDTVFVASPEDTVLAKLEWNRLGDEVSDHQWRDVVGIIQAQGDRLDREYMRTTAGQLGVANLLERAFSQVGS